MGNHISHRIPLFLKGILCEHDMRNHSKDQLYAAKNGTEQVHWVWQNNATQKRLLLKYLTINPTTVIVNFFSEHVVLVFMSK